tara:strand:- start:169 stop:297 length:129 start_codon:yes stop_codon:yes gene_type:complete
MIIISVKNTVLWGKLGFASVFYAIYDAVFSGDIGFNNKKAST